MAFHYLRVGISKGAGVFTKVWDFGPLALGVGMVSASSEELILLIGKARAEGLKKTAMGARTRV